MLKTPMYFPSISSFGVKFSIFDLLYLLEFHKYPRLLLSAYDLYKTEEEEKKKLKAMVEKYREIGLLFMDSGIFESSWKKDPSWDLSCYKSLMSQFHFDLYTSFDVLPTEKKFKDNTFKNALESSVFENNNIFVVILHGDSAGTLVSIVKEFVDKHQNLSKAVAIAERDCGHSILERAGTVSEIRRILSANNKETLLHMLGCGNPLSMLLFAYCGVDTFDSLDWLKFAINLDPSSHYSINDFSHLELLKCKCRVCTGPAHKDADYLEKVLLHNLLFYQDFMVQIQGLIQHNNIETYLRVHFGDDVVDQVNRM
jgi:hypothetical protein